MPTLTRRQLLLATAALAVAPASAQPRAFPSKPIRMVVPFPAGGPTDAVVRHISNDWQVRLGWQTVVENKAGASGFIGHEDVARQPADGYTLMALVTPAALNYKFLNKTFSLPDDFTPIGRVYTQYIVMVVNPKAPGMASVRTLNDLFAVAKSAPDKLNYTSAGNGSGGHLTMSLLSKRAGVSMVHIAYRGDAPAMNDVLAGTVPVMSSSSTSALPHIQSGRLRALAVSSSTRVPELTEVPTLIESGFPGVVSMPWNGLAAPPGMPAEIVDLLTRALRDTVGNPDIQQKFRAAGMTPAYLPPNEFADFVNRDFALWSRVITENNIRVG